jgi:uncharacterized short protein YbdD (DUF466 family)
VVGSAAESERIDRSAVDFVLTAARGIKWWVTSLMGDNDYARYLEHLARTHPGEPVPTEREYWRQRHADADANPRARCC